MRCGRSTPGPRRWGQAPYSDRRRGPGGAWRRPTPSASGIGQSKARSPTLSLGRTGSSDVRRRVGWVARPGGRGNPELRYRHPPGEHHDGADPRPDAGDPRPGRLAHLAGQGRERRHDADAAGGQRRAQRLASERRRQQCAEQWRRAFGTAVTKIGVQANSFSYPSFSYGVRASCFLAVRWLATV